MQKKKKKICWNPCNPCNPWLKNPWFNTDGETVWALRDVSFTVEQGEVLARRG
jgi:ABC-type polysaccharide/polyol phosphate transport system ATPase subunit